MALSSSTLGREVAAAVRVQEMVIEYASRSGSFRAIDGVSFELAQGELLSIVGPSGCGKSSILSALAGLVPLASGVVEINGREVTGPGNGCAVVFQGATLLPWRTVEGNVAFGLEAQGRVAKEETRARVAEALNLVGLSKFANAYPYQLSGGMQQRANVARALVVQPDVLLLDEPFGALDAQTRERLQREFEKIWMSTGVTAIFVTHDVQEAVSLADRVMVLSSGPGSSVREVIGVREARPRLQSIETVFPRLEPLYQAVRRALWQEEED